ncbi:pLS20_p028 family conjugation system transmembrane protein [uncultured Marinococcus sp.]|uniref:pLS20_p028 family conjugation system transmembrane protein n=1 Tax=uncultured Marinococcus sp. TaxID=487012 RepID=UPI00262E3541|nr:hypothetical protein [uncultured Marinococcus sp.]
MNDEQILEYLERFSDELTKGTIVIDLLRMMAWMFVKGMAWIVDAFQNITDSMLGLKLLYDNPQITEFVNTMQPVLVILMAMNLMFIGYLLILKQDAVNRPALVSNIFMALAIMTILSVGMNQANEFTDQAVDAVNFENGTNTLADDAIKNNITDVALYDLQGWETTELEEENQINPSYAQDLTINAPLNEDTQINSEETLKDKGQDIVSKKIQTLPDGTREVTDLEDGGWISNITQEYYYRYNVDWVPLIATLTVVAAVLVIIGVKLATLFFNLAFNYVLAPLVAASDMHSGQRMKQVVQNIISIFMVTIMVFLSLKIYMIAADMLNDSTDGLVYVLGMVGLSVAVLDGPNIVERLFGLDAGLKSSWGALAGTYAAAKGAAGVTKAGMSGVRNISDKMSNNKEQGNGGSGNPNTGNSQDREDVSQAAEGQAGTGGTGNVANMADYRGNKAGTDSQNQDTANESVTDQGDHSTANGSASSTNGTSAASATDQDDSSTSTTDANENQSSIPSLHEEMDDEQAKATGTDGPAKGRTNRQGTNANATSPANGQRPSSTSGTTESPDMDETPATGDTPASVDANTDTGDTASVQNMNSNNAGQTGTHREQVTRETDSSSSQDVEQDMQTVQGQQASGGNVQTNQSGSAGESASTETPSTGNAPASASANTDTGDTASVQNMNGETTGSAGTHRESVTQEMDGTSTQNVEQDVQTVQGQQASGGNVQTNQAGTAGESASTETPSTGNAPASAGANTDTGDTASVQNMNGETTGSAGTHRESVTQEMDGTSTQNVEQDVQTVQGQQQASGGNGQTNQSGSAANVGSPDAPATGNAPASASANTSGQDTASVQNVKGDSAGTTGTHREQVTQEADGQQTQNVEQDVQTVQGQQQASGGNGQTNQSGSAANAGSPDAPATGNAPASASANSSGQDTASVRQEQGPSNSSASTHREQVTQKIDGQQTQNVEQDVQTVQGGQQASGGSVQTNQSGSAANAGSPDAPATGNAPASASANSSGQDTASVRQEQGPSNSSTSTHREQVTQETDSSRTQNVEQEVQTSTNHRQDGGQVNTTYTSGGDTGGQADPPPSSSPGPGPSAPASSPSDAGGNSVRHEHSTEQGHRGGTSKETIQQEQTVQHQGNDTEQDVQQSVKHRQTEGRVNRRERVTEQQEPMKRNYDLGKNTRKTVKRNNKRN